MLWLSRLHHQIAQEKNSAQTLGIVAANLQNTNKRSQDVSARLAHMNADPLALFEWTGDNADLSVFAGHYTVALNETRRGTNGLVELTKNDLIAGFDE